MAFKSTKIRRLRTEGTLMMWIQIILLVYLCIYIARLIEGPSIWNRLLGANLVMTKIILIIITFASTHDTGYFLDFAIIYAICGFIGTIFLANFMSDRVIADKEENQSLDKKKSLKETIKGKFSGKKKEAE
jgi:multicomponent Na+:H+ antiporter subunit F